MAEGEEQADTAAEATAPTERQRSGAVTRVAILAAIGGLLFGYDTGVISGAAEMIEDRFGLSDLGFEIVVSAVLVGATIGAASAGAVARRVGRRPTILLASVLFLLGAIGSAFAPHVSVLIISRVIVGLGVGLVSVAVIMYISETAPPSRRGALVSLYQFAITVGIFVATLVDEAFVDVTGGWRWELGIASVAAVVLFIGMAQAPESPRYLIAKGKLAAGRRVLSTLIPPEEVDETIADLQRQLARAKEVNWREIFSPAVRGVLLIGAVLAAVQQFTGINTIIYYDVTIFARAGFDSNADAVAASIIVGFVNMAATVIAIRYVDRLGRKPLLVAGLVGMTTGLVMLGIAFFFEGTASATVSLIAMLVYIASFAASLGPVVWVLIGEIYPQRVREPAMSFAVMVNWISNFVVALTFLSLLDALGSSVTFFLYAAIAVLSIIFVVTKVPETKGRSLEEIADETGAALEAMEFEASPRR